MNKMSKKIKLTILGEEYQLPISALKLKKDSQWNEETYIHMSAKHTRLNHQTICKEKLS